MSGKQLSLLEIPLGAGSSGCVYLNVNLNDINCVNTKRGLPVNLITNNIVKVISSIFAEFEHYYARFVAEHIDKEESFSINKLFLCNSPHPSQKGIRLFSTEKCRAPINSPVLLISKNGGQTYVDYLREIQLLYTRAGLTITSQTSENIVSPYDSFKSKLTNIFQGLRNILHGINELNKFGFYHKDIKNDNIVIDDKNVFRLIDFGLSSILNGDTRKNLGSVHNPYFVSEHIPFSSFLLNFERPNEIGIGDIDSYVNKYINNYFFKTYRLILYQFPSFNKFEKDKDKDKDKDLKYYLTELLYELKSMNLLVLQVIILNQYDIWSFCILLLNLASLLQSFQQDGSKIILDFLQRNDLISFDPRKMPLASVLLDKYTNELLPLLLPRPKITIRSKDTRSVKGNTPTEVSASGGGVSKIKSKKNKKIKNVSKSKKQKILYNHVGGGVGDNENNNGNNDENNNQNKTDELRNSILNDPKIAELVSLLPSYEEVLKIKYPTQPRVNPNTN